MKRENKKDNIIKEGEIAKYLKLKQIKKKKKKEKMKYQKKIIKTLKKQKSFLIL